MKRMQTYVFWAIMVFSVKLSAVEWNRFETEVLCVIQHAGSRALALTKESELEAVEGYRSLFHAAANDLQAGLDAIRAIFAQRGVDFGSPLYCDERVFIEARSALREAMMAGLGVEGPSWGVPLRASSFALMIAQLLNFYEEHGGPSEWLDLQGDYETLADAYLRQAQLIFAREERAERHRQERFGGLNLLRQVTLGDWNAQRVRAGWPVEAAYPAPREVPHCG